MDRLFCSVTRATRQGVIRGALPLLLQGLALALLVPPAACARATNPFAHTFESPEQLAAAVGEALERRDADRLLALALSEEEFRTHVWPRLPASRPERGAPFGFVWAQLSSKSRAWLRQSLADHGGGRLEVVRVRFRGDTTDHGPFLVHRDAEVVVNDGGTERRLRLFGSVLEQNGRYKLFSYVVD